MRPDRLPDQGSDHVVAREALVFWGVGALVLLVVLVARVAISVLLLTFGGVLFGSALRGAAESIARRLHWRIGSALVLCIAALLGLLVGAGLWIEPRVTQQLPELWTKLVQGIDDLRTHLASSPAGEKVLRQSGNSLEWLERHFALAKDVVFGATGAVAAVVYVAFVALYYAFSPDTYRRGLIALVPPAHRPRALEVLAMLGATLQRWVWARALSMTVLGIATTVALWLLGIPLALTLGFLSGILLFVPYLGAIASSIPALLVAATVGPFHILYVAVIYVVIHAIDGYVLDPFLQKRAIRMPPVLILASQLVIGALWGIVGFTFATPLVAAVLIATRMLYVNDILHADVPSDSRAPARNDESLSDVS